MTKAEILKALEPYPDDHYVNVLLYDESAPFRRVQLAIQKIEAYPGWHGTTIVGVHAHRQNAEIAARLADDSPSSSG